MRAAVFQGAGRPHKIERVADPSPSAGEVLLKVASCGICGSDITSTGPMDINTPLGAMMSQFFQPGLVLGHEISGEVVAVGDKVTHFKIGDRIAAMGQTGCGTCLHCLSGEPVWCRHMSAVMGGYAEYARVSDRFSIRLPDPLSFAEGALVEPLAASLHAVSSAGVKAGDKVLVYGTGIIGLGMAYFARRAGAARVVVVARTDKKKDLALRMGADAFLSQRATLVVDVTDLLDGPPDIVLEGVGAKGVVNQAIECLRPTGTLVLAGFMLDMDPVAHGLAAMKGLQMKYVMAYTLAEFQAAARCVLDEPGKFDTLISATVSLDDFPETFESLRNSSARCKVMVVPQGAGA